jgi:hypothetical protein
MKNDMHWTEHCGAEPLFGDMASVAIVFDHPNRETEDF